jgi:vitamin B12 transporter
VYVAPGNVLTAGAELSRQDERADGTSRFQTFAPSATHFDESRRNAAYYAQWAGEARGVLGYTASARFDDNQRFGGFGTYRVAAAYALPTATRVRAAIGTSFKEPLFTEQFATAFTVGNPDLDPERAATWEVGVEQGLLAGRGSFGVTYFDQRFRNLVQYRGTPSGAPPTTNYFNVAAANARGVEVDGRIGRPGGASLRAAYTYLDTRVVDAGFGASGTFVQGDRLLRRPTHSGSVTASAPLTRRGSAALTVNYVGDRDDRDFRAFPATPVVLGGYATLDAATDVRVLQAGASTPVALTFRVENLLDREYEAVKNYVAPGRTILAGVRFGPR